MSTISGTLAINKAIDVIEALSARPQGSTQTELLGLLPITRRTLHRILYSLCERGLVRQDEGSKRFFVATVLQKSVPVPEVASPDRTLAHVSKVLHEITQRLHTPSAVYCRDGQNALAVFQCQPPGKTSRTFTPDGLVIPVGSILPTFGILLFMSDTEIDAILEANAFYINDNNLLSREHVFSAVKRLRQYGFICCQGCIFPQMSNVVLPLTLANNCHGSLCVQIPRDDGHDETRDAVLAALKEALRLPEGR